MTNPSFQRTAMLHRLHRLLVGNNVTRKYQRRITRKIKYAVHTADAYGDLIRAVRLCQPAGVLDLGSFQGETIVRFLDEVSTTVHGFEPTPVNYEFLCNRFSGNKQVVLHNVALSNANGTHTFFSNANPQTNSLLDNDVRNSESFQKATEHKGVLEVQTQTLDSWAEEHLPSGLMVIKSDIQGAEGLLLDGAKSVFSERVAAFYSEAQIEPMYKNQIKFCELHTRLIEEFGFSLHNIYPCMHDSIGRAIQTDALWINTKLVQFPPGK